MALPPPIDIITSTIHAGEALSDPINLTRGKLINIIIGDWESAQMTLQISPDDTLYSDLCDEDGNEITMPVGPHTAFLVRRAWVDAVRWIKIRSGSRNAPERQRIDVTITLVLET